MSYAELHCKTNFSFLVGASHADELVTRAIELDYKALAITDENSLAGVVRAYSAARNTGMKLIIGSELTPHNASPLVVWAMHRRGYGNLARLLTLGRRRTSKGNCSLTLEDIQRYSEGLIAGLLPTQVAAADWSIYREIFGERLYMLAELAMGVDDEARKLQLQRWSEAYSIPLVAAGNVLYHAPERMPLHNVLTAIRHGSTVELIDDFHPANSQRHLQKLDALRERFAGLPGALERTVEIADRCHFDLAQLRYEYPEELAPNGSTPITYLKKLTWEGAAVRYPHGIPDKVRTLVEHELQLIEELHYEAYFLTVWDLVRFARQRRILCQGRGSAANSAVCFCLGITSVDPGTTDVLFERFISKERNEAPDIDVDFEHERREEVLQYLYDKYGRERAGLAATVITYRIRSAIRDVGKAIGLSLDRVDALAKHVEGYHKEKNFEQRCQEVGIDPHSRTGKQLIHLVNELQGFPRHLSQHVGGMVMTRGPLCELVPIENAAMADRTVIQWDKNDLEELGILKVDCLCLGMLTAIRKCFDLVEKHHQQHLSLATIPQNDPRVYDMICASDTMGVFQIESRAQMSMLPRLRPRCYYDLVIEVAIVRPGPIQGNMVHPYLRRRAGEETVSYPTPEIEAVLNKTLGVPIFQEQAMRLAVVAAGFTPGEADQLRRAMGAWRKTGVIEKFKKQLIEGMHGRGLSEEFAMQVFQQIRGFGEYGFPESHAASFALLVYVSAWLKHYYPAAFTAALINAQPMGFYSPSQLVTDAQKHNVPAFPVDVNFSDWDCTLELLASEPNPKNRQSDKFAAATLEKAATSHSLRLDVCFGKNGELISTKPIEIKPKELPLGAFRNPEQDKQAPKLFRGTRSYRKRRGPVPRNEEGKAVFDETYLEDSNRLDEFDSWAEKTINEHAPRSDALNREPQHSQLSEESANRVGMRLGMRLIQGFPHSAAEAIMRARQEGPFKTLSEFTRRTGLSRALIAKLSAADAFRSLERDRRQALWEALAQEKKPVDQPLFGGVSDDDDPFVALPEMAPQEEVFADYRAVGLSLKDHPISFHRDVLNKLKVTAAEDLDRMPNERHIRVAGLVILRQRPSTAKGITFVTLEDETGTVNLILKRPIWEKYYRVCRRSPAWIAHGKLERRGEVTHIVVNRVTDFSQATKNMASQSRDFR